MVGWLAVLYLVGMLGSFLHLATADHHNHLDHHADHACGHAHDSATVVSALAAQIDADADDHCCHQLHDVVPTKLPRQVQKILTRVLAQLRPQPVPAVMADTPERPRWFDDDTPPPIRSGVTTVAAGRAPPASLHA